MGDLAGFAAPGYPVVRRPSQLVRLNRNVSIDRAGAVLGSSAGRLTVVKEIVYAGLPTGAISGTPVLQGVSHTVINNGTGGAVDIIAAGVKVTCPATGTAEAGIFWIPKLGTWIGEERWRRGRVGIWTRVVDYVLASTVAWHTAYLSSTYPYWGVSLIRSRNYSGTANTASGGWNCSAFLGGTHTIVAAVDGAAATDDVSLIYYRSPFEAEMYRGSWSNETGWPLMEQMTFSGLLRAFATDQSVVRIVTAAMTTSSYYRILETAMPASSISISPVYGGAANNASNTITVDRTRLTTWE